MTITFSPRDENKPVDLLEETQKLYQHTAQELMAAVNLIKEGNLDQVKAATIAVKELRQALTWAMEERASFEKRNKGIAGAGLIGMVKRDRATQGGRIIELWQDFALPLSIGDEITLEAGCDRQATTCAAKFNNMLNFQGFPFIPGEDWQISYPNSIQIKDGGSLFK